MAALAGGAEDRQQDAFGNRGGDPGRGDRDPQRRQCEDCCRAADGTTAGLECLG